MRLHRSAWKYIAYVMLVLGFLLTMFSYFALRPQVPEQVAEVSKPISVPSGSASPSRPTTSKEAEVPVVVPEDLKPVPLYEFGPLIGDRIGTIALPALDLSWPIFEGTDEAQLSKGVGHYTGSVLPGMEDNSILSGHRTTVFNRLGELELDDQILIETSAGVFTYKVREFKIVDRSDQTVIMPEPSAVLTLTTCYPFNSIIRTTQAYILQADLVESSLVK